jgi:UDPglucose 6-dehydrogenase
VSNIAVVGTGYVGLPTGSCLAHLGHDVVCTDLDGAKIAALAAGEVALLEDALQGLVQEGLRSGRLRFSTDVASEAGAAEFVFLCVPTPQGPDGAADLSHFRAAARMIGPHLGGGAVVVNKSTLPVGSTRVVEAELRRPDVFVVSNPEFLREGSAVHDFLHPDRIVIGSDDQAAAVRVSLLYLGVRAPLIVTDAASAELIKYASNAFLATKLSFVNEIAAVCEATGADVHDVVLGMGYDKRIGHEYLRPGPGWGGSCLPKDTRALVQMARDAGEHFELLEGVITVNEQQFERMVDKVALAVGGDLEGAAVGLWGLTFKSGTNDLRDSPALGIARRLAARGAKIRAYDPTVDELDGEDLEVVPDPYAACEGADVLAVLTEWSEFRWLDLDRAASAMARRAVIDTRNVLDRSALHRLGFKTWGVGWG